MPLGLSFSEWHAVLEACVARAERTSPTRLELTLAPTCDLTAVVDLAQREVACCPFFTFVVQVRADGLVLVAEVPDGASATLDALVSG